MVARQQWLVPEARRRHLPRRAAGQALPCRVQRRRGPGAAGRARRGRDRHADAAPAACRWTICTATTARRTSRWLPASSCRAVRIGSGERRAAAAIARRACADRWTFRWPAWRRCCRCASGALAEIGVGLSGTNSRPIVLQGLDALIGQRVDDALLAALGKRVQQQASPMRSTATPSNYRRQVAAVLAQRLVRELAAMPATPSRTEESTCDARNATSPSNTPPRASTSAARLRAGAGVAWTARPNTRVLRSPTVPVRRAAAIWWPLTLPQRRISVALAGVRMAFEIELGWPRVLPARRRRQQRPADARAVRPLRRDGGRAHGDARAPLPRAHGARRRRRCGWSWPRCSAASTTGPAIPTTCFASRSRWSSARRGCSPSMPIDRTATHRTVNCSASWRPKRWSTRST